MRRRLSVRPQCLARVDVHGPTPFSYKIKSRLTPWGCLISFFAFKLIMFLPPLSRWGIFLNSSCFFPPLLFCCASDASSGGPSLSGRERWNAAQTARAVLPSRSSEVWPLSVPVLSQLSHRACSPDCAVSQTGLWVSVAWLHCACVSHSSLSQEPLESLWTNNIDHDDFNEHINGGEDGEVRNDRRGLKHFRSQESVGMAFIRPVCIPAQRGWLRFTQFNLKKTQLWIACFLIIATSGCMTKDANRTDFSQSVSKSRICNSTWVTVRNTNTWKWSGSDQRLWWEWERRAITIMGETYLTATRCKEFCLATIFSCKRRNNVNSCEIKLLVKMFRNDSHKKNHSVHLLSSYMIVQTAQCPFAPSNIRFASFSLNSSLLSNGLYEAGISRNGLENHKSNQALTFLPSLPLKSG